MYNLKKQWGVVATFWRLSEPSGEVAHGYYSFLTGFDLEWKNPQKNLSDEEIIAEVKRLW